MSLKPTSLRIATTLCVLAGLCSAEIDLTPLQVSIGGGIIQRTHFADGNKTYAVTIDAATEVTAPDRVPVFRFKNVPFASMTLRHSPLRSRPPFDAKSNPEYVKVAQALLPGAAEGITIVAEAKDVLPINGWQSYRVVFSYTLAQAKMMESITFLNFDANQQLIIQTGARAGDFAFATERADEIMRRWHEVLPGDEKGEN